jgi:hypothetical protein
MSTLEVPSDVAEYLAVVRNALADLPADERDDLLAEVEASLLEAAGDSSAPVAAKLGPPEEFAAELRSAAGLHEAASQPTAPPPLLAEIRRWLSTNARVQALRRVAGDLAPIWWVARGYLAVALAAVLTDAAWSTTNHAVPRLNLVGASPSGELGLFAIVAAAAISVWIGLRTRGRTSRFSPLLVALNVVLVVAAVPVARAIDAAQKAETRQLVASAYASQKVAPVEGVAYNGVPIQNIYPYSLDGKLLHDVLLYDGAGRPLAIGGVDSNRRIVVVNGWDKLLNAFPIRYYEPGTRHVAHPNAGPPIRKPGVLAPADSAPTVTTAG